MNIMPSVLEAAAHESWLQWLYFGLELTVKGTIVLLLGLVFVQLLAKWSAATCNWILVAVCLSLLLLPVFRALLPSLAVLPTSAFLPISRQIH